MTTRTVLFAATIGTLGVAGRVLAQQPLPCTVVEQGRVVIGAGRGTEIGQLVGAVFVNDTVFAIADDLASHVAFYSTSGRRIRVVGRKGQGPGEFRNIRRILSKEDTVVIADQSARRLSLFTLERGYVRALEAEPGSVGLLHNDVIVTSANPVGSPRGRRGPELWPDTVQIRLHRRPNVQLLATVPDRTRIVNTSGEFSVVDAPFTRVPIVTTNGRVVVVADGSGRISRFRNDGAELAPLRSPFPARAVTRGDLDRWVEHRVDLAERGREPAVRRLHAVAQLPRSTPAHGGLVLDPLSRIWIEEYRAPHETSPGIVMMIGQSGEALLRASLPPRSRILAASTSVLAYATRDDLDAETVTTLRFACR